MIVCAKCFVKWFHCSHVPHYHIYLRLPASTLLGQFHSQLLPAPLHLHLLFPRELQPLPKVHPVLLSGAHMQYELVHGVYAYVWSHVYIQYTYMCMYWMDTAVVCEWAKWHACGTYVCVRYRCMSQPMTCVRTCIQVASNYVFASSRYSTGETSAHISQLSQCKWAYHCDPPGSGGEGSTGDTSCGGTVSCNHGHIWNCYSRVVLKDPQPETEW